MKLFTRTAKAETVTITDEWGTATTYATAQEARAAQNKAHMESVAAVTTIPGSFSSEW